MLVVMMRPCKNMRHLSGKTVPLAIGAGGSFIDAVWEMNNLLRVDPVPECGVKEKLDATVSRPEIQRRIEDRIYASDHADAHA